MLVLFVLAGVLLGGGLLLIFGGVFARAMPLAILASDESQSAAGRAASPIEVFAGDAASRLAQDLAVCDRTPAKFASDRVINTAVFAFLPGVVFLLTLDGNGRPVAADVAGRHDRCGCGGMDLHDACVEAQRRGGSQGLRQLARLATSSWCRWRSPAARVRMTRCAIRRRSAPVQRSVSFGLP